MTAQRRPTRTELARYADATVPDLLPDARHRLRLLFVGINPSLWSAAVGAHFARPGNRFWRALYAAGITDRLIDASAGMCAADVTHLSARGIGITNLVSRATARADLLDPAELRDGRARLGALVSDRHPAVVAVAGVTSYRVAFGEPKALTGRQPAGLHGSQLWVVPNPSGLNAHATVASLAVTYARVATAAGIAVSHRTGP